LERGLLHELCALCKWRQAVLYDRLSRHVPDRLLLAQANDGRPSIPLDGRFQIMFGKKIHAEICAGRAARSAFLIEQRGAGLHALGRRFDV
jgi:hypothetical protein